MVGRRLSRSTMAGYGIGAMGTAGFGTVPGLVLAIYLTNTLGVAAALASIVVLIPKLWDAFFLPYVGGLSDRGVVRHGSRTRLLVIGALGMLVSFPLMFAVPAGTSPLAAALWVLIAFLVAASAFAYFLVPYVALPAEITDSPSERTNVMSWRVGFQFLGVLVFGVGAPLLISSQPVPARGYLAMGLVIGFLIFAAMLASWLSVRRLARHVSEATAGDRGMWDRFRLAWKVAPFRLLLLAFVIQALGAGAVLAAAPYFSAYVLGLPQFGIVFGVLLVPAVAAMPLWAFIGHRIGKRRGYLVASILFILGLLCSLGAAALPVGLALGCIALASIGYAGMQMFPLAMLPDVISEEASRSGEQRAGSLTGVWTAGETVAFAIGPAMVLLTLAIAGYASSTAGFEAAQTPTAIIGVQFAFSILPAVLVALSLPFILRDPMRNDHRTQPASVTS